MNQHQHLAGRLQAGRQGLPVQGRAAVAQRHHGRQRAAALGQPVPQHAVECSQHGFALRRLGRGAVSSFKYWLQPRQQAVQALAHKLRDTAHTLVDQPGEAAGLPRCLAAAGPQCLPHRLVNALRNVDDARCRLGGQLGNGARVRGAQVLERIFCEFRLGHGGESAAGRGVRTGIVPMKRLMR